MMRLKLFLGEAYRSITSNVSTTAAAVVTVLVGMFILGLFVALGSWALSYSGRVQGQVQVKVFFDREAATKQINDVNAMLGKMPDVKSYTFVSKEEALKRMKKRYPDLVDNLSANPLPASFEVKPIKADRVDEIAARFDPPPAGVEKATYPKKETKRVLAFAKGLGIFFLIGSVLLLAASTLLIANTIRLSIFSRRREIEVMKLVGATNWFVRGPFMLEGLFCGLAGSVVAIVMLVLAREFAPDFILRGFRADGVNAWSFPLIALILVAVSLVVGAAGSGITLRRFLRI